MSPATIWESTLENVRSATASGEPVPAGVAVSAISASLALGLLAKVLKISGRRKDFPGNQSKLEAIADSARAQSKRMMQVAEEDMVAFNNYMASARLPQGSDKERDDRKRSTDSAVRKAIEMPIAAARAAASGIELCAEAAGMVNTVVAADLGAAASLLSAALRVFLLCADSNFRQLAPDPSLHRTIMAERLDWETKAFRQAESVLKQVAAAIDSVPAKQPKK
jgi:formiminotetrahydrofolate cyclodeaminase